LSGNCKIGYQVNSKRHIAWPAAAALCTVVVSIGACSQLFDTKNSLSQHTGEAGSTIPSAEPPEHPNTSGNIVAPPGNPGGNPSGAPPIVGGTTSQQTAWPDAR
jgi:hypothetical protein